MLIQRDAADRVRQLMRHFPVVVVTGPRQSGKTTLLRSMFPDWEYLNLESPSTRELAEADPEAFLRRHGRSVILDEVQRLPVLMSQLQVAVDADRVNGRILVSGSQNLLLAASISQSLAGRAAYLTLPPLTQPELARAGFDLSTTEEQVFQGSYPGQRAGEIPPAMFFDQYLATYVERDVRQLRNVADLAVFRRFLTLLAGRIGQIVDHVSLAGDAGVSPNTVKAWLSVLEASYLIHSLPPFHNNFGKRYAKRPKIYFADTGLACRLLGLTSAEQLEQHFLRGGLFENYVVAEVRKRIENAGLDRALHFYRDSNGTEVDLVIDDHGATTAVEIKSSSTFSRSFLKGLAKWRQLDPDGRAGRLVYAGRTGAAGDVELVNFQDLTPLLA